METYFTEAGRVYLIRFEDVVELAQSATALMKQSRRDRDCTGQKGSYLFRRMLIFLARGTCDGGPAARGATRF